MGSLGVSIVALVALSHAPGVLRVLLARLAGMRVDRVVIGFFPILRREKWTLGALPLCTFVLIAGRDATGKAGDPELFSRRPLWGKLAVLLAAPLAFYLVAALLMAVSYVAFGLPQDGTRPVVGSVRDGSAGAQAGLEPGDLILSIDGKAITATEQVKPAVEASTAAIVPVEIERAGERHTFYAAPQSQPRRLGIEIWQEEVYARGSIGSALGQAALFPARYARFIFHGFAELFTGKQKAEFSGPVGIVKVMDRQVGAGVRNVIGLLAIIAVYQALWFLLWFDGPRAILNFARRRLSGAARDCGEIDAPRGRIPLTIVIALVVIALPLVMMGALDGPRHLDEFSTAAVILCGLFAAIAMRRVVGWRVGRYLPLVMLPTLSMGIVPLALSLPLPLLLSRRAARDWFGLRCPTCNGGDARQVLGEKNRFGCLRCGSAWLSRG